MSDHIVDLLGDFLEDRLDASARAAVEAHVAECRECAADLAFARVLREQETEVWAGHPTPDRIVAIASGEVAATAEEEAHLKVCDDCGREAVWVRSTPPVPAAVVDSRGRRRVVSWAVGITAVAAALATFVLMPRSLDSDELRAMARFEPLPVQIVRGGEVGDDTAERRLRGLEAYRDGQYEEAVVAFQPLAANGDVELRLYLGSALLLLDRPREAVTVLGAVVSAAGSDELRDLALWQLANAHLAGGNHQPARLALSQLRDLGGAHAQAARDLLDVLD